MGETKFSGEVLSIVSPKALAVAKFSTFLLLYTTSLTLWFSGVQHFSNTFYFYGVVLDYNVASPAGAVVVALIVPWLQLVISILLVRHGIHSITPSIMGALLSGIFVFAQVWVLTRGAEVDCGCFGVGIRRPVGAISLSIAAAFLLASVACIFLIRLLNAEKPSKM